MRIYVFSRTTIFLLVGMCAFSAPGDAKTAGCTLRVDGRTYLEGPCNVDIGSGGSFSIGAGENTRSRYFAYVNIDKATGIAQGYWNGVEAESHAHDDLGQLTREGACWVNNRARVCARAAK